ncbi:MAG: excisionase family DNA-binding protein [Victivallales bacterium]|nr:excisionase family DNA-binding protein [Victivallales bacterium]
MSSDESLWKAEDVGKYLNVSKDTIYRWIESKQMPAVRTGAERNGCFGKNLSTFG